MLVHFVFLRVLKENTLAPVNSKPGGGSTGKGGTTLGGKTPKIVKSGNPKGSSGKDGNIFGSSGKSSNIFGSSGKSGSRGAFIMSGKGGSKTITSERTPSMFGTSSGKNSSSFPTSKPNSNNEKPLARKDPHISNEKFGGKTTSPVGGGAKTYIFDSSSKKDFASTSFSTPKQKSSTAFGFIWIPGRRRNKKKDYTYVSHRDDYKDRSPTIYPYEYMSGDSPSHQPFKKKEEDTGTLILERPRGPIATAASAGTAVIAVDSVHDKETNTQPAAYETDDPDDKEDKFIRDGREESQEGAGDASYKDDKDNKSFLENESLTSKSEKEREDKVDSVYLHPPPPHKARSNASSRNDDDDCGIKCLYYTLQCCDCVLM